MPAQPMIEDAVAIVPVRDIPRTMDFYADILGFERRFVSEKEDFAIVVHGEAAIHFVACDDEDALKATANNISIYLWVKQVDALFAAYEPRLVGLDPGRVRPPFDQPYGMREFHIKDPDGCLLLFGENIDDQSVAN